MGPENFISNTVLGAGCLYCWYRQLTLRGYSQTSGTVLSGGGGERREERRAEEAGRELSLGLLSNCWMKGIRTDWALEKTAGGAR